MHKLSFLIEIELIDETNYPFLILIKLIMIQISIIISIIINLISRINQLLLIKVINLILNLIIFANGKFYLIISILIRNKNLYDTLTFI